LGEVEKVEQPWNLWITGLSGSGKTTISKQLLKLLNKNKIVCEYLRLDDIRQFITPDPKFTREERELVYRCGIYTVEVLNKYGVNTIIDSVDGQGYGRDLARKRVSGLHVVWIDCPIEVCIEREKNRTDKGHIVNLYEKAKKGLTKLPGLGYEYVCEKDPLLKIDSTVYSAYEAACLLLDKLV